MFNPLNKAPDKRIIRFIRSHHVLTMATSANNIPWCANCFYVYLPESNELLFTSDDTTRHISEGLMNNTVAGSVVLESRWVGKIRGLQFTGTLRPVENYELPQYRKHYLKRFPYTALTKLMLWKIILTGLKYTDNRLGFGTKIYWPEKK